MVLFVVGVISVARAPSLTSTARAVWILALLVFPLLGSLVWFTVGRRSAQQAAAAASGSGGLDTTLKPADPETWRTVFGDIDDALSQEIVVRVTTAFFERHLRHRSEPILDIPTD